MTFTFLLKSLGACSEAVQWRGKRDLKTTWAECERGDWMLWLCAYMADAPGWPTRPEITSAACDCAELSLEIFEKEYPNDKRPRVAIETARKWVNGEATVEKVRSAAAACANAVANTTPSTAAVNTTPSTAAVYAATAIVYATAGACATTSAASSSYADVYAATAVVYYASRTARASAVVCATTATAERLRECADICRAKLKVPEMKS